MGTLHDVVLIQGGDPDDMPAAISALNAFTISADLGSSGAASGSGRFQKLVGEKKWNGVEVAVDCEIGAGC